MWPLTLLTKNFSSSLKIKTENSKATKDIMMANIVFLVH